MKATTIYSILLFLLLQNAPAYSQSSQKKIDSVNSISSETIVSNLDSSLALLTKNLANASSIHYTMGIAMSSEKLSFIYYLKGNLDTSTEYLQNAVKIYEATDHFEELSILYGEYGYRMKKFDFKKAKEYMQKGILIAEGRRYVPGLAMLYDNYGVLKEMENDIDSALYFYRKALGNKKNANDVVGIPYSFNKIAGAYALKGEYDIALRFLDSSDVYRSKETGEYGRCENLVLRGEIMFAQGNLAGAIPIFRQCANVSRRLKNPNLTEYCYEQLALLFEKKKDFKSALTYFKSYSACKDSMINIKTNQRIAELQTAYETEKKDQLIATRALDLQKKNNVIIFLAGITGLTIICAGLMYRVQKMKKERIKSELTLKNQLEKAKYENKLRSELLRISRDLHDNIGSQLTFIISSLDTIVYRLENRGLKEKLVLVRNYGKDALSELRNTVWAIKQENVDFQQLVMKINDMIQRIHSECDRIHISFNHTTDVSVALSSSQVLNLYRIIQEAFQNIIKHADSTEVSVEFADSETAFIVLVCDNGRGVEMDKVGSGNGLRNMRERCTEVGGNFSIAGDAMGTRITCSFPKI